MVFIAGIGADNIAEGASPEKVIRNSAARVLRW